MAFCTKCGASMEGAFCTQCGNPAGSAAASGDSMRPPAPPIPNPPQPAAPPPAAPKKGRAIFWVLGGCLGLIVIAGIIMVAGGYFVARKAGLDPVLMKTNPALAAAKMIATLNPELEVVSVDEAAGLIHVRDKKTGKSLKLNLKDVQKGKIVFQDDQNKSMEISSSGEGDNASFDIKSDDGSVHLGHGSAANMPDWVPSYPGAKTTASYTTNANDKTSGSYTLSTTDSVEAVSDFYENALNEAGFAVEKNSNPPLISVTGEDSGSGRKIEVKTSSAGQETSIILTFESR